MGVERITLEMVNQVARTKGTFTFLEAEVRTGLTFAGIASRATDESKIKRNSIAAQRAYEAVCHFSRRVPLTPEETRQLEPQVKQLRQELSALHDRLSLTREEGRPHSDQASEPDL